MKARFLCLLGFAAAVSVAIAQEITLETARPVVVKSVPESGSMSVDPGMTEVRVTFSKEMQAGTWSWCMIDKETYPGTSEAPKYLDDKRTCVLPVKLQPGKNLRGLDQFRKASRLHRHQGPGRRSLPGRLQDPQLNRCSSGPAMAGSPLSPKRPPARCDYS